MSLDLERAFAGHEILITGVTGFLGKVALTMLLDRYPDVGRIHVLVRARAGGTAEDRFFGKVAGTQPFRPLRERHGDGFEAFLRKKQDQESARGSRRHNLLFGRNLFLVPVIGTVIATQTVLLWIKVVQDGPDNADPILCEKIACPHRFIPRCHSRAKN